MPAMARAQIPGCVAVEVAVLVGGRSPEVIEADALRRMLYLRCACTILALFFDNLK